jgi:hypothetical protein
MFLNLDGIPSAKPPEAGLFLQHIELEGWCLSAGDRRYQISDQCRAIDLGFRRAIITDVEYETLVGAMPIFAAEAGLSADCPMSRDLFAQALEHFEGRRELNKFLYFYDCERLVSSVSQCLAEVNSVMGEFYFALNTGFDDSNATRMGRDTVVTTRNRHVTQLVAYLNFIFIRLHSILDYLVKIAIESQSIKSNFIRYTKMSSIHAQYGDRKKVTFNGANGTLFESCAFIHTVEALRNHLIHDGLLEESPRLFERVENAQVVERFLLFPDMTDGRFDRYVNRALFYGREDKINLRLPDFIQEFQARLEATLAKIVEALHERQLPSTPLNLPKA